MLYRIILVFLFLAGVSFSSLSDLENDVPNALHPSFHPSNVATAAAAAGGLQDIRYLLWTRSNSGDSEHYRLLPGDLNNLRGSPLIPNHPTLVLYHGFNDEGMAGWITRTKTEILKQYDFNIISVDWSLLVPAPWYNAAVNNAYRTANYTASLLDWLAGEADIHPSLLHITGHSLGAHAAGLTAKYITTPGTVRRVTGLDPAGPLFYTKGPEERIDKSDALFVDIMHTNSGSIIEGCAGLLKPLGHVDFYPNGGMHQPGCVDVKENDIGDIVDVIEGCSHARATQMWVESITALPPSPSFTSWPCTDWDSFFTGNCTECRQGCLSMGYHVSTSLEGTYYLRTNPTSPFALGDTQ